MRLTLRDIFEHSVKSYEDKSRDEWVFDWPAQPALVGTQIWWTTETNQAFEKLEEGTVEFLNLKITKSEKIHKLLF